MISNDAILTWELCLITQTSRSLSKNVQPYTDTEKISFGKNTLFFRNNIIFKDFFGGGSKHKASVLIRCIMFWPIFNVWAQVSPVSPKGCSANLLLFEQNLFISATCLSSCLTAALCLLSTASKHRTSCWFDYQRSFEGSPEATGSPFLSPLILVITALNEAGIHCLCFSLTKTVFSSHFTR